MGKKRKKSDPARKDKAKKFHQKKQSEKDQNSDLQTALANALENEHGQQITESTHIELNTLFDYASGAKQIRKSHATAIKIALAALPNPEDGTMN